MQLSCQVLAYRDKAPGLPTVPNQSKEQLQTGNKIRVEEKEEKGERKKKEKEKKWGREEGTIGT